MIVIERRNVYKPVEGRWDRGNNERNKVTGISQPLGIYQQGLPVPVSVDSQHLLDEPGPDGLHGSAWLSLP